MFHRILVALEDTPSAKTAFDYAVKLARRERAQLHVLSVGPMPELTASTIDEVRDAQRHAREEIAPLHRSARDSAEARGQPVVTEMRFGHAADVITEYAAEHGVDLIVLGKKHRHLGSVGERVIRHASCPVFVAGDAEIVKYTGPGDNRTENWEIRKDRRDKLEGWAKMLRIYIGEDDQWERAPLYEAIVRRLREKDIAGATVFRGIMGFGANQRVHKSGFLGLSRDLPMLITIVDSEEKIRHAITFLDGMVDEGLIVLSDVEVIEYKHTHAELEIPVTPRRGRTDW
jgi:PII-like signaling protein/nucleotide-binding universal stress UspA family protein